MKCLIINGSPHKGNTWALVEVVKSYMSKLGEVTFEEIHLSKLDIPMCLGCNTCFFKGENKCPHSSLIQPIAEKISASDCVIITSPSYSLALSATCKNFIDHMSYNFHRPRFFTKKMLVISTTAGAGSDSITKYIRDVFKFWGFNDGYRISLSCFSSSGYKPTAKVIKKCESIADKFYKDVTTKKMHPATLKRIFYYNVWRSMSLAGTPEENMDNHYWLETGMRDMAFYKEIKIGILKKGFGNFIYGIMRKFMYS